MKYLGRMQTGNISKGKKRERLTVTARNGTKRSLGDSITVHHSLTAYMRCPKTSSYTVVDPLDTAVKMQYSRALSFRAIIRRIVP